MLSLSKTILYLIATLVLAIKLGLLLEYSAFFAWGMLMAAWEQPTDHWARSIFKKWGWPQSRWDATESWKLPYTIGTYRADSRHLSKSLSIILVSLVVAHFKLSIYQGLAAGWVAVESFNLFYNCLFDTEN